jgi:dipeptidyl-peptidase-4
MITTWLDDGSFLWQSERTGWRHLYHYAADGKLIKQVTDGKWEFRSLEGIDEKTGWSTSVGLNTVRSRRKVTASSWMERGSLALPAPKEHIGSTLVRQNNLFLDFWSDINTPPQVRLVDAGGKLVRVVADNKVDALKELQVGNDGVDAGEDARRFLSGRDDDQAARF